MAKKRDMQRRYKEELDRQQMIKDGMKPNGKMSNAEKLINKDDLLAYKYYDGTQYALVPGVTSRAKVLDRSKFILPTMIGGAATPSDQMAPLGESRQAA